MIRAVEKRIAGESAERSEAEPRERVVRVSLRNRPRLVDCCFGALRQQGLSLKQIEFSVDEARPGWNEVTLVTSACRREQALAVVEALTGAHQEVQWSIDEAGV